MGGREWSALDVSAPSRKFIEETGFKRMSPVQAIAIPLLLNSRDVAVEACTGSGKTLSFLIPAMEMLLRCEKPEKNLVNIGAVVLAPTRELTLQIYEVLGKYIEAVSRHDSDLAARIQGQLFVGGTDAKVSAANLQGMSARGKLNIVVATPGRLMAIMQLAGKELLNMKTVELLVLDEADRLLQLGFAADIQAILGWVPKQRRTGLFSATLTSELQALMKTGMRNPVHVCVRRKAAQPPAAADGGGEGQTGGGDAAKAKAESGSGEANKNQHELPSTLSNYAVSLPASQRLAYLATFLQRADVRDGKTIVFFMTCACVDLFYALLRELLDKQSGKKGPKAKKAAKKPVAGSFRVERLHGQMDQSSRKRAYEKFSKSPLNEGCILLATDVAARGIDVENVGWIVQFAAPADPTAFVHRIGRVARAGRTGRSLLLLSPSEDSYLPYLRKKGVPIEPIPDDASGAASEKKLEAVAKRSRKLAENDRSIMLKAKKAFVSLVRAYQEHTLNYLFPFNAFDFGGMATSYCCLRMPRMKEILGRKVYNFEQSTVDPETVPFTNKGQEKVRQEKLVKMREEAAAAEEEWKKPQKKEKPEKLRTRTEKRKTKRKATANEWDMLALEERLAKKVRQGRMSASKFEKSLTKAAKEQVSGKKEAASESSSVGAKAGAGGSDSDGNSSDGATARAETDCADAGRWLIGGRRGGKKKRGKR